MTSRRFTAAALTFTALFPLSTCGNSADHTDARDDESREHTARQSLGEPREGYPTYPERLVLYFTNRARTEPSAFNEEETYPPAPPLRWDLALSKAGRWQARHILEDGCWCEDHSSCCDVAREDGSVQCLDSPGSCGATGPRERVSLWTDSYSGENAAQGQSTARKAMNAWINSSGHWKNITSAEHDLLGVGEHESAWVQDFGRGEEPPVAGDGIHFESGARTAFGITYYQPGTGGPQSILAVVDGTCHELDLAYGEPELGAFETSVSLEPGCHRYYFHVTDGDGATHTYPSEGSLAVDNGADDCPLYRKRRPADTCSPAGEPCETGDTRPCYTGPFGTEGVGICEAGTERCIGGEWQGNCRYQTKPEAEEICENGTDDDCDGSVDEMCGGDKDAGHDLGADAGERPTNERQSDGDGCAISDGPSPPTSAWMFLALCAPFAHRARRRYRERRER